MNNQELITAISEMNTVKMIHLLNESKHYPKSKKEVLIKDLTMIFNHLKIKDSLLEIIEGKCYATFDDCKNADKTGWLFLAKKSKKYFSLIFREFVFSAENFQRKNILLSMMKRRKLGIRNCFFVFL